MSGMYTMLPLTQVLTEREKGGRVEKGREGERHNRDSAAECLVLNRCWGHIGGGSISAINIHTRGK